LEIMLNISRALVQRAGKIFPLLRRNASASIAGKVVAAAHPTDYDSVAAQKVHAGDAGVQSSRALQRPAAAGSCRRKP
jgi:hypothetical protein